MTDIMSPQKRSQLMSRIRSKNTGPEMIVRRLVHGMGYGYRLHQYFPELRATPDLVFKGRQKIILVHGCFWHRHSCKLGKPESKTHPETWKKKFEDNVRRDRRNLRKLKALGWDVLVIWECQTGNLKKLADRVDGFLKRETAK